MSYSLDFSPVRKFTFPAVYLVSESVDGAGGELLPGFGVAAVAVAAALTRAHLVSVRPVLGVLRQTHYSLLLKGGFQVFYLQNCTFSVRCSTKLK